MNESIVHIMPKPQMARQGDVLLVPLGGAPDKDDIGDVLKEGSRLVLAHGEVTGHAHAIYPEQDIAEAVNDAKIPEEAATLYELRNLPDYVDTDIEEGMYLHVRERSYLRHEEHQTISLAPGHYGVIRQIEVDNEMRRRFVAD